MEEEGKAPALPARAAETGESASGRLQCLDVQSLRTLDVGQTGPDIIHKEAGGSVSLHTPTLTPPKVPGWKVQRVERQVRRAGSLELSPHRSMLAGHTRK